MNHTVFKQEWRKSLPDGVYEVAYSIHLSQESLQAFIDKQSVTPTLPGYVPFPGVSVCEVNDEIYQYLMRSDGIWRSELS